MKKFLPTIGMEIHVELSTKSKMFCSCPNGMGMEKEANKNICPVCTGQPGSLPVPNKKAIEFVIKAGLALNCQIAQKSKFDRKNYFYPDLPKGYQISQYDQPLCQKGFLEIELEKQKDQTRTKKIGITRIHLEEDTGKLLHLKGTDETLVDFNRAGVPLMELVTDPCIGSAQEAKVFCEQLRLLFRYLGISPADMEKGQMRCEANISLYPEGQDPLSGTKVELKNLNSFKSVERGIEYEIKRQKELLEKGEQVIQETRGWDESKGVTFPQRAKEESHDYRYFPDPDLLPLRFSQQYIDAVAKKIPELPLEKTRRFVDQMGLLAENAKVLVKSEELANYFENVSSELQNWMKESGHNFNEEGQRKLNRLAANYIITELQKHLFEKGRRVEELAVTAENFAELIKIVYEGKINSSAAQKVLGEMVKTGGDPSQIIDNLGLTQSSDPEELKKIAKEVITENPKPAEDFKSGKENALKFLIGQIMRKTKGAANPKLAEKILKEELQ